MTKNKYPFPAFLSMILPGLGQLVKGQLGIGLMFMIINFINFILMAFGIGFITHFITWVMAIHDAYNTEV